MSSASCWRLPAWIATSGLMLGVLAGCGSVPHSGGGVDLRPGPASSNERDGPGANPPRDLASIPDAQPRVEPIRRGGPNKPYEILGRDYVPITDDRPFTERGLASWYGRKFHGHPTASGEPYDMYAMTAAHPTLPIPSYVRVRNPANDREVIVRVNDRGPFHPGRIIDLSYAAAFKLDLLRGVAPVELTRITYDEIRAGTWRHDDESARVAASAGIDSASARSAPGDAAAAAPRDMPALAQVAAVNRETAAPSANDPATPPAAPATPAAPAAPATVASLAVTLPSAATAEGTSGAPRRAAGYWVQLGAFRQRDGAELFQRRVSADLDWLAPVLLVFSDPSAYRLQAGPYASRGEAQGVADRVHEALNLVPMIVERR